jgi:hypothetical protein
MGRAEQEIQQRELRCEILVARVEVLAVMPVMELWRCDKPTQWPKADAEIGMDENRLPLVKYCETAIAASEKPSAKIGASEIPLNAICSTG